MTLQSAQDLLLIACTALLVLMMVVALFQGLSALERGRRLRRHLLHQMSGQDDGSYCEEHLPVEAATDPVAVAEAVVTGYVTQIALEEVNAEVGFFRSTAWRHFRNAALCAVCAVAVQYVPATSDAVARMLLG